MHRLKQDSGYPEIRPAKEDLDKLENGLIRVFRCFNEKEYEIYRGRLQRNIHTPKTKERIAKEREERLKQFLY